ncbi:MAG: D-2-hydroxyacid dehydrogenase [Candidatus Wallbacteria bacterium]|nr:D-2-hydroxyacid dehydrogenase [Candidatus Wallbacteria bacterium]
MFPVRIAVAACNSSEEEEILRREVERVAPGRTALSFSRSKHELFSILPAAEVFFGEKVTARLLAAAPALRWVHVNVAGVERSMTPELAASPVVLTNSRAMHRTYIAEHVLGLMLAFAKRLEVAIRRQSERVWAQLEIVATNFSLAGRVCGVLGLGGIGMEVARLAHAFGMRCVGTRRRVDPKEPLPPYLERVLGEEGTDEVVAAADFLVICLPLTDRTRRLLSRERIGRMKAGAYVINIARGAIADETALLEALAEGRLAGAGLDVTEVEPLPADSALWGMERVILTPHVSGNYPDYAVDAARLFAENLRRYLAAEPLLNVVDKREGY